MLKKFLTIALVATTCSFAAGWDYFNPKYAGNAQVRTGVSFDHEYKSATPYLNSRFVINEDAEVSFKVSDNAVTSLGLKYDILDMGAVAIDFQESSVVFAAQVYKDFNGVSLASELSVSTEGDVQLAMEGDTYFFGHVQYAGFTADNHGVWSPYCGYVYPLEHVDLGATYFLVMEKTQYLTSGWSLDVTFKF